MQPNPRQPQDAGPHAALLPEDSPAPQSTLPDKGSADATPPSTRHPPQLFSSGALGFLWRLPAVGIISIVRGYQICLSPLLPAVCRFEPTCSSYLSNPFKVWGRQRLPKRCDANLPMSSLGRMRARPTMIFLQRSEDCTSIQKRPLI